MKLSSLKIDSAKAEQGEWVRDIPDCGDLALKVRDPRNADARRLRQQLASSIPRNKIRAGRIDPTEADRLDVKVMAQTILIDWAGLTADDGSTLPYSQEKALELLSDPDMRPFRDAVAYAAGTIGDAAADQAEADAGN